MKPASSKKGAAQPRDFPAFQNLGPGALDIGKY